LASPPAKPILVLAAGEGLAACQAPWADLLAKVKQGAPAVLLWMSDADQAPVLKALAEAGIQTEVIPAARLLQEEVRRIGPEYGDWLRGLAREMAEVDRFWCARLTELNFADPIWFQPVRFNVAADLLDSGSYLGCVAVCDPVLHQMMADYCRSAGLAFAGQAQGPKRPNRLKLFFNAWRGWAENLGSDLAAWRLTRGQRRGHRADWLIYAHCGSNWREAGGRYSYRYSAGVAQALAETDQRGAYLVPLARRNARSLKRPAIIAADWKMLGRAETDLPVIPVEAFGRLGQLLASYFSPAGIWRWFRRWRSLTRRKTLAWRGADMSSALAQEIVFAPWRDWPALVYLEKCLANAFKVVRAEYLLVQGFEFVEGRAAVRAAAKAGVKTAGFEHGCAGVAESWRSIIAPAIMAGGGVHQAACAPDIIGYESAAGAMLLTAQGFPPERTRVFGAARLNWAKQSPTVKEPSPTVMILGDLHRPEAIFSWVLDHLSAPGLRFIFRPHPLVYDQTRIWLVDRLGAEGEGMMSPWQASLEDELDRHRPACVLVGLSGAAIDVVRAGTPVVIIRSNWLPDYNPLTAAKDSTVLSSHDPAEVRAWLERLGNEAEFRAAYVEGCQSVAEDLVETTGIEAARRLVEPF